MSDKWFIKKISDIIEVNPKESLLKGKTAKKISMDILRPFCRDISKYELSEYSGGVKFRNGDTIMARITPCLENGKTAKVNILDDNEVGFGSTEYIVFRAKKGVTDEDFVYYLVCSPLIRDTAIKSMVGSSGRQRVQTDVIQNLEIALPDLDTQKRIGSLLKSIDDRIASNTAINENLEQQAQALFKAWFVDFEPFGGVMPDDWQIVPLGELCDSISKKHRFNKPELIFLNTGDVENGMVLHNNYSEVSQMPGQAKKSIAINDILYSEIRPINKHFTYVNFNADDYVVSTKLMVLRAKGISPRRLYQFLTMPDTLNELQHEAETRSGTFPQIRCENIQQLEMIVASEQIENEYSERLNTIYSMIDSNNAENQRLAALRDTLLPKLMNGEIDVSAVKI